MEVRGDSKRTRGALYHIGLFARLSVSWVLSPILGSTVVFVLLSFVGLFSTPPGDISSITDAAFSGAAFGVTFGIAPAFVFGAPLQTFLLKKKWTSPGVYILGGGFIGLATFAILFLIVPLILALVMNPSTFIASIASALPMLGHPLLVGYLVIALSAGAMGGLIFWLIRRPDRGSDWLFAPEMHHA